MMNAEEVSEYLELIDELQKKKMGDSNELKEWKQKLTENKELDKAYLDYLTALDVRLQKKQTSKQNSEVESVESMSADQLQELTKLLHDEYKEQWDKDGVVHGMTHAITYFC